jgi:hypothetical protein
MNKVNHPHDSGAGPFNSRGAAEAAFGNARRRAEEGTFGNVTEFNANYLTDTIDQWAPLGQYDRLVIFRLAAMLDTTDLAVVASWFYRVTGDKPSTDVNIVVNPEGDHQ